MKHKGLLLIITLSVLGLLSGIKGYSQEAYIKYTVNGKAYNFKGDKAGCYQKKGDRDEEDKVDFLETTLYVDSDVKAAEKLGIVIRTEQVKKIETGKYTIQSLSDQTEILPNANLRINREIKGELEFFGTVQPSNGVFTITKVEGVWIEGTFEAELPSDFEDGNAPLKVTNGSFRVRLRGFMK
ncbi:MAG: hypothetical protein BGO31_12000 [Bacteroidetes bacterium 43-16]|nr:MAG: hypothetical protein BGO31_12000 [Bacteroidetes bacterium 43-16]